MKKLLTVMAAVLDQLTRLMAPILAFTSEEVWGYLPGRAEASVHLADWPEPLLAEDEGFAARYDRLFAVRSEVLRNLEALRAAKTIGNSLEAVVTLHAGDAALREFLAGFRAEELQAVFIVSEVRIVDEPPAGGVAGLEMTRLTVLAEKSPHEKCPRCWRRAETVGAGSEVCGRCRTVLSGEQ